MTMRTLILLGSIIGVVGMAQGAEPYLPKSEKTFTRIDVNRDGKINAAEFTPIADRFFTIDTNRDGVVSTAEIDAPLQAALERKRNRILASLDKDRDGNITKPEIETYAKAMLAGADTDKSGEVTFDEAKLFKVAKWRATLTEPVLKR
jgi:Ca2+-binding EF-hand superfamily protein